MRRIVQDKHKEEDVPTTCLSPKMKACPLCLTPIENTQGNLPHYHTTCTNPLIALLHKWENMALQQQNQDLWALLHHAPYGQGQTTNRIYIRSNLTHISRAITARLNRDINKGQVKGYKKNTQKQAAI